MKYLWISLCIDYLTFIKLINYIGDVDYIYKLSLDKNNLLSVLTNQNIHINYDSFTKLIDQKIKLEAESIYNKRVCYIINIFSKYYPSNLKNIFNPPIVIFVYGNIKLLNNKKVLLLYESKDIVYNNFCKHLIHNNISILQDKVDEYNKIIYTNKVIDNVKSNCLYITDNTNKFNLDMYIGLCDYVFLPNSKYTLYNQNLIDIALEYGKDILVIPGNVYEDNTFFNNYLIKNGAICITSKQELLDIVKDKTY